MNNYKTGKVYKIEKENGVGYVVDGEEKYLFTSEDQYTDFDNLEKSDEVRFRAEKVEDINRAFFVKKELKNKKTNLN